MVAHEAHDSLRPCILKRQDSFDDGRAVGAAVDIVPEKNELVETLPRVIANPVEQQQEKVLPSMNVTDRVSRKYSSLVAEAQGRAPTRRWSFGLMPRFPRRMP
jgi:hypothetical protein